MSVQSDRQAIEDRLKWRKGKDKRRKPKQQPFPDVYGGGIKPEKAEEVDRFHE